MSNRVSFSLAVVAALVALLLLVFSFSIPSVVLTLAAAAAGYLMARTLQSESGEKSQPQSTPVSVPADHERIALANLFEATMGGMREGLLVVDRDMKVVASNPAARRLFNTSLGKLNSQRLTELTRNPAIYAAFLDALQGHERSDVKVETFGEGRHVFDLRVVPLNRGEGGLSEGAIGVFFDITRLERLEKVRQEFLSNVSHELRTPLTAILTFVETIEAGEFDDSEDTRRFLSIIRRNATRMRNLIDDILELSAIEAGTVKLQKETFALAPLVDEVMTSLGGQAASRNVTMTNGVEPEVLIHADPVRLEQMLTNLIDNAIKFNREGGRIIVRYELGEHSRVLVEDTGQGIPAQHLERLFERFYRVDRARSREMGGTGLGLAIVKHLALAHGGEVTVQSKLGEGTVFAIDFPRDDGQEILREKNSAVHSVSR